MLVANKHKNTFLIVFLILTIFLIVYSLSTGYYHLSIQDVIRSLLLLDTDDSQGANIVYNIRIPRVMAALVIGGALSVSGSTYQGMFKNPLVSPDILGVASGASVGASIAIISGQSIFFTQTCAFLCGLLAAGVSYYISLRTNLSKTVSLILAGTVIGSVCTSIVSMLKYTSDPNDTLPEITFWLMGSLSKVTISSLLFSLIPISLGLSAVFLSRWKLNILMLEDDDAKSLGVNTSKWKLILIISSTVLTSAAVCLGGIIGWIGLMVPHIARFIFGSNYRHLIPCSLILGSAFLLLIDTVIRMFFTTELPIGVFTSILGAPFFLTLILKKPVLKTKRSLS